MALEVSSVSLVLIMHHEIMKREPSMSFSLAMHFFASFFKCYCSFHLGLLLIRQLNLNFEEVNSGIKCLMIVTNQVLEKNLDLALSWYEALKWNLDDFGLTLCSSLPYFGTTEAKMENRCYFDREWLRTEIAEEEKEARTAKIECSTSLSSFTKM